MSEWVSVFDRLPEEEGDYLVTWEVENTWGDPIRSVAIFWYGKGINNNWLEEEYPDPYWNWFKSQYENECGREISCVTAWRELPEPYKEGK
jgi:hypothetical protein